MKFQGKHKKRSEPLLSFMKMTSFARKRGNSSCSHGEFPPFSCFSSKKLSRSPTSVCDAINEQQLHNIGMKGMKVTFNMRCGWLLLAEFSSPMSFDTN
jgi:hypothetical protein